MKNTISKFNVLTVDQETSPPSSEYTTPAQSQTTSPTRETSPPSFVASEPSLNNLMSLGLSKETSVSPSSSPTQGGVSSLATHSMVARRLKTQTLPNSSRVASLGEVSSDPRRLSDSVLQREGVQQLKAASEGHLRSPPIVPSEAREMRCVCGVCFFSSSSLYSSTISSSHLSSHSSTLPFSLPPSFSPSLLPHSLPLPSLLLSLLLSLPPFFLTASLFPPSLPPSSLPPSSLPPSLPPSFSPSLLLSLPPFFLTPSLFPPSLPPSLLLFLQ